MLCEHCSRVYIPCIPGEKQKCVINQDDHNVNAELYATRRELCSRCKSTISKLGGFPKKLLNRNGKLKKKRKSWDEFWNDLNIWKSTRVLSISALHNILQYSFIRKGRNKAETLRTMRKPKHLHFIQMINKSLH